MQEDEPPEAKRSRLAEPAGPTAKPSLPRPNAPDTANPEKQSATQPKTNHGPAAAAAGGSSRVEQPSQLRQRPSQEASLARTVFVRGMPVDADRYQLQRALEVYGPLIACRQVPVASADKWCTCWSDIADIKQVDAQAGLSCSFERSEQFTPHSTTMSAFDASDHGTAQLLMTGFHASAQQTATDCSAFSKSLSSTLAASSDCSPQACRHDGGL